MVGCSEDNWIQMHLHFQFYAFKRDFDGDEDDQDVHDVHDVDDEDDDEDVHIVDGHDE